MAEGSSPEVWMQIDNVDFSYPGMPIFSDLSLTLDDRHMVLAVVGQSGVGKSTLIALLAGFSSADAGAISICGDKVMGPSAARPVVFQDHNLYPWKNVLENVEFGLKAKGLPNGERNQRAREILKTMRLEGTEGLYPKSLSGGMQQRVGLARALAVDPLCVLMDEPFGSLDQDTKNVVQRYFRQTIARINSRTVLITHDIREAVMLSSFVLVLRGPGDVVPCDLLSDDDCEYSKLDKERNDYWTDKIQSMLSSR
ncbi:MAG: ATP-binding cassette domain-containing protein [Gammaproteobacteria bacterium]|nr:ATP-binding cassette domain-containing protein [Gammaproteobacteria bacterium]MDH3464355.1 ATP-binding cassette domain-containing protein [Gammaproteobacteria bacterium]